MGSKHWDQIAQSYNHEIVSPLSEGVENPLFDHLQSIPHKHRKTVADLGCGTGNLLSHLAGAFKSVYAIDYSARMISVAKQQTTAFHNIIFHRQNIERLRLPEKSMDVVISVNSLLMPDVRGLKRALTNIHKILKPQGQFLAVLPAMEGFLYQAMLIYEEEIKAGHGPRSAYRNTQKRLDSDALNFELGLYTEGNMAQKFYYRFEIIHRLKDSGFTDIALDQVLYPWDPKVLHDYELFEGKPRMWDWFVYCVKL